MTSTWFLETDRQETWAYWKEAFTPDECQQIIALGDNLRESSIGPKGALDDDVRKSRVQFLHPSAETDFIFRRLVDVATALNRDYFGFDILAFAEGLQLTEYDDSESHYTWHTDKGLAMSPRKLSISVQLSDPDDYDGGDLELYVQADPVVANREQGHLILFPSYTLHRVTPVTRGVRRSLVAWIAGPPFR